MWLCCCMVFNIMNGEKESERDCFLKTEDFAELVMESSTIT